MIDANIALGIKPAEIASPLDQYGKLTQLRSLMDEHALRQQQVLQSQAQTQDIQAQVQDRQRKLTDQKVVQDAILKQGSLGAALPGLAGRISTDFHDALTKSHNEDIRAKAAQTDEQLKQQKTMYEAIDDRFNGIRALADDQKDTEYVNTLNRAQSDPMLGEMVKKLVSDGTLPAHYDSKKLDTIHAQVKGTLGILNEAEKTKQIAAADLAAKEARQKLDRTNLGLVPDGSDQKTYDAWRATLSPEAQARVPQLANPAAIPDIKALAVPVENQPKYEADSAKLPAEKLVAGYQLQHGGLTPEQVAQQHDRERAQQTAAGHLWVSQQELGLKRALQEAEIGGNSAQTWVDILKANPDLADKVPEKLRTKVASMFKDQTGLPFPKPINSTLVGTEFAARNAIENGEFVKKALQNPEIQKSLGAILGRLGEGEQAVGNTLRGLSPEAQKLAQELRTRMRYFVFQEGKAILGGRLPQQLMKQLETSSASVHMDEPILRGALNGAIGAANANLDNLDKERFGGQVRSEKDRGLLENKTVNGVQYERRIGAADSPWKKAGADVKVEVPKTAAELPKSVVDSIPEGKTVVSPSGVKYKKVDGKLVEVKK